MLKGQILLLRPLGSGENRLQLYVPGRSCHQGQVLTSHDGGLWPAASRPGREVTRADFEKEVDGGGSEKKEE